MSETPRHNLTIEENSWTLTMSYAAAPIIGFENPMTTAADMIVGGTDGETTRLPKGSSNQVLSMNSDGTAQEWVTATSSNNANTIVKRDSAGGLAGGSITAYSNFTLVNNSYPASILNGNITGARSLQLPDASGTLALASQPRCIVWKQNNTNDLEIGATYTRLPMSESDANLDPATNIDFSGPFSPGVLAYLGTSGKFFNIIATVDIENQATSNAIEVSLKIGINDNVIDATQCNATVAGNGVGKLHSMWLTELDQNDTISLWLACPDGTHTVVPVRWRLQVTSLL